MTDLLIPPDWGIEKAHLEGIGSRVRRALRNRRGINLTFEHLQQLAIYNLLQPILEYEDQELCRAAQVHTQVKAVGSTSVATGNPPTSGRSLGSGDDRSYISALTVDA